jgi:hypothetical protein
MTEDFHAALGVPRDASQAEIRRAYLKLAKQYHPDLNPNDASAAERFKQVHRAFEHLYRPWGWRFRGVGHTPGSAFAKISSRPRIWTPDPYARELAAGPANWLVFLGLAGVCFGIAMAAIPLDKNPSDERESVLMGCVCILCNLIVVVGGVNMLTLRIYGIAVAAAIMAMLPCVSCVCLPGLFVGGWALLTLHNPLVRDAFWV